MPSAAVVGLQWGDEGKGKLVTQLARGHQYCVRYQGGANAGHTVYVNGKKLVLHHIPSGIVVPGVQCLLMPGMVIDPETLLKEIEEVKALGVNIEGRIRISGRVHIITDYHRALDQLGEKSAGSNKIGTTGRGIGHAYADKAQRLGLRAIDLLDSLTLRGQLQRSLAMKNALIKQMGGQEVAVGSLLVKLLNFGQKLKPFLADTPLELADAIARGDKILYEGAQAAMLDIDQGTYPYVTSSATTAGGIGGGCGVNVGEIEEIIGVVKAYCTRVGEGPFPTELKDELGDKIRDAGGEFGSTTGRPRRCGWFDAHAVKVMARLGRVTCLCVTKLDVLTGLKELKIGKGYKGWDKPGLPESAVEYGRLAPDFETHPGFEGDISGVKKFGDLPKPCKEFIKRIEELTGLPVRYVSTGPETEQLIERKGN